MMTTTEPFNVGDRVTIDGTHETGMVAAVPEASGKIPVAWPDEDFWRREEPSQLRRVS